MSTARALSQGTRCLNCQRKTLLAFASVAGVALPLRPSPATRVPARRFTITTRRFAFDQTRENPDTSQRAELETSAEAELLESESGRLTGTTNDRHATAASTAEEAASDPNIPWYLQTNGQSESVSHQTRQQKPDLPNDSPEKLNDMVEHLFMDIGLDDMRILDLRAMSPPPALGSNLIMIVGTTRSEKHLHVSADRFCRWLRSTYQLRPYADGLLGRNELKIRLRRKAKRAKLLGSKAQQDADFDDGIRTGWVCVNVGAIEKNNQSRQQELDDAGIVGFSSAEDGTHLVVQMMTAEKREELEIEKLWLEALAKQENNQAKPHTKSIRGPRAEAAQVGVTSNLSDRVADHSPYSRPKVPTRSYHSLIRQFHSHSHDRQSQSEENLSEVLFSQTSTHEAKISAEEAKERWSHLEGHGMTDRLEAFWAVKREPMSEPYESSLETLAALSEIGAIENLGTGPHDLTSTPFLRKCFSKVQPFPNADYWTCRIYIAMYAMLLGHPSYVPEKVASLFARMESDLPTPPISLYRLALEAFVPCPQDHPCPLPDYPEINTSSLSFILSLTSRLSTLDPEIDRVFLYERVTLSKIRQLHARMAREGRFPSDEEFEELDRIPGLAASFGSLKLSEGFQLNYLALLGDLDPGLKHYLKHWVSVPVYSDGRSRALYAMFFDRLAQSDDQRLVATALDDWVDMMDEEAAPVRLEGDVAMAVARCLQVVKPDVDQVAAEGYGPGWNSPYVDLWRRCHSEA